MFLLPETISHPRFWERRKHDPLKDIIVYDPLEEYSNTSTPKGTIYDDEFQPILKRGEQLVCSYTHRKKASVAFFYQNTENNNDEIPYERLVPHLCVGHIFLTTKRLIFISETDSYLWKHPTTALFTWRAVGYITKEDRTRYKEMAERGKVQTISIPLRKIFIKKKESTVTNGRSDYSIIFSYSHYPGEFSVDISANVVQVLLINSWHPFYQFIDCLGRELDKLNAERTAKRKAAKRKRVKKRIISKKKGKRGRA